MSGRNGNTGAWEDFWNQPDQKRGGGCVPDQQGSIGAVQEEWWREQASRLPHAAAVLDLGTGGSVALKMLSRERKDLKLTGVDSATKLPEPPRGVTLRSGVQMETLPFRDCTFDFVMSQFGLEYAQPAAIAEAVRVMRRNGRFAFLTHRAEGPITAHNRARANSIRWLLEDSDLLLISRNWLAVRQRLSLPIPPRLAELRKRAATELDQPDAALEILAAVQLTLERGWRHPKEAIKTLAEVKSRGDGELARIGALLAAAPDEAEREQMRQRMSSAGLRVEGVRDLFVGTQQNAFAWGVIGRKVSN